MFGWWAGGLVLTEREVRSKTTSPIHVSHLCSNFSSYLKYMLSVDIKTNGFLSALPFLCRYLGGILHGKASDALYQRRMFRLVTIRRIFNSVSKALLSQFGSTSLIKARTKRGARAWLSGGSENVKSCRTFLIQGRAKKFLLSLVTHVPSGLMGCAFAT